MRARVFLAAGLALVLAAAPAAAEPTAKRPRAAFPHPIFVGAAEDDARDGDPLVSMAKMTLARLAGYDAIRLTAIWEPGLVEPDEATRVGLQNAVAAAELNGIRVLVSIYHYDSRTTPVTPRSRWEFAQYSAALARELPGVRDFIVGNEPNLNLFWMPQFTRRGVSASPAAYVALLAQTYDALKAVSPSLNVIGGALSPRGADRFPAARHTHSPTRFIPAMGSAYRALRRTRPIMDTFAFHPYLEAALPPSFRHPRSTTVSLNDYGKLTALLGRAFDGTAQRGSRLPIVYDEFGYDAQIPFGRAALYHGRQPSSVRALGEATVGAYYRQALALAACQPNVQGFLFFLVSDEEDRDRWQSGVHYADDTPKPIAAQVRQAALVARAGLGSCR